MQRIAAFLLTFSALAAATSAQQLPTPIAPDLSSPLYQSQGDHERSYKLPETGGTAQLYRIYIPASWDPKQHYPLVVILHGANLDHNSAFDREPAALKGVLQREADKHRFILVAPEGYHGGTYGSPFPLPISQTLRPARAARACVKRTAQRSLPPHRLRLLPRALSTQLLLRSGPMARRAPASPPRSVPATAT